MCMGEGTTAFQLSHACLQGAVYFGTDTLMKLLHYCLVVLPVLSSQAATFVPLFWGGGVAGGQVCAC